VTHASNTLAEYVDGTRAVTTDVTFAHLAGQSGALTYYGIAGNTFTSPAWVDVATMVSYSTTNAQAVSVDASGTLTLRGNSHTTSDLEAQMSCNARTANQKTVKANLYPLELDVDAGMTTGFQFQQSSNALPIQLRVRGITSTGNRAITAFGIKVYGYNPAILSSQTSNGASFVSSGQFSGTASELDGIYNSVVGGLARVVGADSTSTANGGSTGLFVGTLTLGVVGSGVTLIDFEIEVMEIYDTQAAVQATKLQYVDALAAVGYASVGVRGRRRLGQVAWHGSAAEVGTPASQLAALSRSSFRLSQGRALQSGTCDPCASRVWGDFNGDCNFLADDVSALQRFSLYRLNVDAFNAGNAVDPLDQLAGTDLPATYHTANSVTGCLDFIQLQANPTRDILEGSFATTGPRYQAARIDATDSQHLLSAVVKDYRLLTDLNASCVESSVAGSANRELRIVTRLVGGDGQNGATVGADPARTDVFAELRVSPAAAAFEVGVGTAVTDRDPAGGFADGGALMKLAHIGGGYYELRLQPRDVSSSVSYAYQFALLIETRTAAGAQESPKMNKPWLGSSILPYTDSGFSFKPIWGGGGKGRGGDGGGGEGLV
jgi:hypothetical protein